MLNALLQVDRAIVTPIAGTTRDTLEETANLGGVRSCCSIPPVSLLPDDPVEAIGVERSRRALNARPTWLLPSALDRPEPLTPQDEEIAAPVP